MEYVIRKVRTEELNTLIDMCANHATYERAPYNKEGKALALYRAIFEVQALNCFVIEADAKLVGYFTFTFDYSTWEAQTFLHLDCLYLEPAYRGLKIGDAVFEILMAKAREMDCAHIQWQTPAFNEPAIRFYHRMGATGKEKVRFFLSV